RQAADGRIAVQRDAQRRSRQGGKRQFFSLPFRRRAPRRDRLGQPGGGPHGRTPPDRRRPVAAGGDGGGREHGPEGAGREGAGLARRSEPGSRQSAIGYWPGRLLWRERLLRTGLLPAA